MIYTTEYLETVKKLGDAGLFKDPAKFVVGSCLIRGYADLGVEQFLVVGTGKLSSLFTGVQSQLPEGHEHFFTRIPTIHNLTEQILIRNFDITESCFENQRHWKIVVRHIENNLSLDARHPEFEVALADILLKILEK